MDKNEFQQSLSIDSVYVFEPKKSKKVLCDTLTILSWNTAQNRNLNKQIEYIKEINPSFIILQEVDWNNKRSGNINAVKILSDSLNMFAYFAIEFFELESETRKNFKAGGEGGGIVGNAILSPIPLKNYFRLSLTTEFLDWENQKTEYERKIVSHEPREGQRNALIGTIELGSSLNFSIVSTHLEDKVGGILGRTSQMNQIFNSVDELNIEKSIIGGDLNTLAHGFAILKYREGNSDRLTKPKPLWEHEAIWWEREFFSKSDYSDPFNKKKDYTLRHSIFYQAKLDWILVKNFNVVDKFMGDFVFSDHRPLVIKIS
jgi:endonuclease/exonuclease/phosphatase family metal-dependent hydrolase